MLEIIFNGISIKENYPLMKFHLLLFVVFITLSTHCQKEISSETRFVQHFKSIKQIGPFDDATLFKDKVILMKKDSFFVLSIPSFERDRAFEEKLNKPHLQFYNLDISAKEDTLIGWATVLFHKKLVRLISYWNPKTEIWEKADSSLQPLHFSLFRDHKFSFYGLCAGEFGGMLTAENLKNKNRFSCPATCPVQVDTNDGKYYALIQLNHMCRFNSLFQIDNPDSLMKTKDDDDCVNCYEQRIREKIEIKNGNSTSWSEEEYDKELAKLTIGTQTIMDTTNLSVISLFFRADKPYFFYSGESAGNKKNYIGQLEKNKIIPVDSLPGEPFISYSPATKKYAAASLVHFGLQQNGLIYLQKDTVWVLNFATAKSQ